MISPNERKKIGFPLLASANAEMKKYAEVYSLFAENGYSKELCDAYADAFLDNVKKPSPFDIVQLAALYDRIHDHKTAFFYLEKLTEKKLGGDDRFFFCVEVLTILGKIGNWREAENFRTNNISFLQKHSEKASLNMQAALYMALAVTDCAAKNYRQGLKLLKFGYKPQGSKDTTLLEIFITAVYIFAKANDKEGLEGALHNAECCLALFKDFDFPWQGEYYRERIENAANGIL
ncbi:hypothetical protein [Ruminococcus flavefaciens]|uniref:hypothetical protein n=1 Tax=Ruminococcus flavefaciens TaxID=1265 RepID=UPI000491FEED|nr:hypothetical protein [Ruminococcus flavefaciens]